MKRTWICTGVALALLWAGSVALAKDATNQKTAAAPKPPPAAKEARKALTPAERVKKAYELEIAPWNEVKKVAEEEKATKTVAAIDKILKVKEEAYKKDLARLERRTVPEKTVTEKAATPKATK
jgi:hypothetical protein